jgi:hypothetical protein
MKFTDADATNRQSNLLKRNVDRSISLGRLDFSDSFFLDNFQSRNNSIDAETFSVNSVTFGRGSKDATILYYNRSTAVSM